MAPVEDMTALDFDRSNKGASKQRRDQINAEIATMRDLLPLPETSRQRLSQLQIMSLTCVYVRKCNILHKIVGSRAQEQLPDATDFFQALSGFVLVTTREGKLLYISENVTDYLGHSMVDMKTQGDSLYDIVDKRDHSSVQAQLLQGSRSDKAGHVTDDVSFFCRMNMSRTLKRQSGFGDVKVMHVRGHFINVRSKGDNPGEQHCVFMATCSPLITTELKESLVLNNTMVFKTVHKLDMTFVEVTKNGEHHLGCSSEDLAGKSWYSVLHPVDIHQAKEKHVQLIQTNHELGCMVTLRMLRADGTSFWVNSVMQAHHTGLTQSDDVYIVCINQVIDENEAYQIKLQAHMFSVYPTRAHELWGGHLSNMAASPEHHQAGPPHWLQQDGAAGVPVPGYHGNRQTNGAIPTYHGHRMMPYPSVMMGCQYSQGQGQVQPDQLKAMLKRKIQQGPPQTLAECKPTKIQRLEFDAHRKREQHAAAMMTSSYLGKFPHHQVPATFQCVPGRTVQMMQVTQPHSFTFSKMAPCLGMKGTLPGLDSSQSIMKSEQVVPDVPESYLTPDPSPASSPQPASRVKVEVQEVKGSNIIQALEKLAAMPHQAKMAASPSKKRELPIFDAFDIDNFFDALDPPAAKSKESTRMEEVQVKEEVDAETSSVDAMVHTSSLGTANLEGLACNDTSFKCEALSPASTASNMSPVHKAASPAGDQFSQAHGKMSSPLHGQYSPTHKQCVNPSFAAIPVFSTSACDKMVVSTQHAPLKQENLEDLLSYFSDEGVPSLEAASPQDNLLDERHFHASQEDFLQSSLAKSQEFRDAELSPVCLEWSPAEPSVNELSPRSTASSLVGEEDLLDESASFTLALSVFTGQGQGRQLLQREPLSIKDQDVLGLPDELDFILDSLASSDGSLEMTTKHGQ